MRFAVKIRMLRALSPPRAWLAIAMACTGVLALACVTQSPAGPGPLATVTVTPNATLSINATQQFVAVGTDANGAVVPISPAWSVAAGGGAIDNAGLFTAGTVPGTYTATVKAVSGSTSGTATVTVIIGSLATITVSSDPVTLAVNGTQQYTAVGTDAGGNVIAISPTWSVVANSGTISSTGLYTAGTVAGIYPSTVRATTAGIAGTATVTVTAGSLATIGVSTDPGTVPSNGTVQYVAVGMDGFGNIVPLSPTWSVVGGGGTISTTGVFTAGATSGSFPNTVHAVSGTITGSATVTVGAGALATITVSANPSTLSINGTQQYTAVGRDASGTIVAISPTWTVVAGGGTISSTGLFTVGTLPGSFPNTVRATSGIISGTATVSVNAGSLANITLSADPVTLAMNGSQQYTAVGTDAGGNVVAITPIWSVIAGGGTITSTGLFTAGTAAGTFQNTVRATSGSIATTATVTVTSGTLASITVTPGPATLPVNGTLQYIAVGKDAAGNIVPISPTWTVVSGGGTISGTALFTAGTAPGTFANTVKATSGSISGTATVTVTSGALATIVVTPNPDTVPLNGTRQFTAVGKDASGAIVAISPTWSVVAGGGAISSTALFTAGSATGTYLNTVRASSGTISGTATVDVIAGTLASITVTPGPASLPVNGTQLFTAVGKDAFGTVVPITPTWSVVANGGAIISTGLFSAGTVAGTFNNTVKATSGTTSGFATVTVTAAVVPPPLVALGAAATHGILAGSAVTCVNLGLIAADVSVWPGSAITGFGPCVITGARHAADPYAQAAQASLTTAYTQLNGLPCGATLTADLGGRTLQPGVYCSLSSQGLTGEMFFDALGDPNASFVIKAASTLTTATAKVTLLNGAQARNIYWLIGSSATLGVGSAMKGNIIAFTSITLVDNSTLFGRALARNGAVTLGTNNVITLP